MKMLKTISIDSEVYATVEEWAKENDMPTNRAAELLLKEVLKFDKLKPSTATNSLMTDTLKRISKIEKALRAQGVEI